MFAIRVKNRASHGWSMVEYSILVVTLAIALMAMQVFVRRAVSSYWKSNADQIGGGRQYDRDSTVIIYN